MSEKGIFIYVIIIFDDIVWLFNIRGGDVKYNLVVFFYVVIILKEVYLFVDESKLNEEILNELVKENV